MWQNRIFCRISNATFNIQQEIWLSHLFLMLRNFEAQGYLWYGVGKRIKCIFAGKGNYETR